MIRVGALCSGYGGLELGLVHIGLDIRTVWRAEVDPIFDAIASEPNLGDIREADFASAPTVSMLTAGWPCQPVSAAGAKLGEEDPRWLWPHVRRAVHVIRPRLVFLENVAGLLTQSYGALFREVVDSLVRCGYAVRYTVIGACHVGAAHHRQRVFILAKRCARQSAITVQCVPGPPCPVPLMYMFPTPTARDGTGRGEGTQEYWDARQTRRTNGMPLGAAVTLLPILDRRPTRLHHRLYWQRFHAAVARQESIYGPAPRPAQARSNGKRYRLAPEFVEWLMCVPAGHVTAKLNWSRAITALGNGVCPPQAGLAYRMLEKSF